jgi:8-oxo-dGTP pyrophosphatase MutT (NUDIX family)
MREMRDGSQPMSDAAGAPAEERGVQRRIAAKAVALVVRDGRVLVERCADERAGTRFLRAIGGSIEFGETAADAAAREWREELGLDITGLTRLGVLENRFVYEGRPGHEIVFVFAAALANADDAGRDEWTATDTDGRPHTAVWMPVADVVSGAAPVVPDGVAALLRGLG